MRHFEYDVSLRVSHPSMDADTICKEIGLRAEHKWTAGSQRATPIGRPFDGVNKLTYCCFPLQHPKGLGLVDFLDDCNDRLYRHKEFFRQIRLSGGTIEYFIGWYCDKNCGEVFDLEFLSKLVALQLDLSIDFYGASIPGRKRRVAPADELAVAPVGVMNLTLLEQFLKEECTQYVRSLLHEAVTGLTQTKKHFEFNRFDITIDFEQGVVVIEDDLDPTDSGIQHVPIKEFTAALAHQ